MREKEERKTENAPVPKPSMADADLLGIRSIQFRTWLSFVALTAITLIILWSVQIIFHITSYREMSKSELARAGDRLVSEMGLPGFGERLRADAIDGGFAAVVVDADKGKAQAQAARCRSTKWTSSCFKASWLRAASFYDGSRASPTATCISPRSKAEATS